MDRRALSACPSDGGCYTPAMDTERRDVREASRPSDEKRSYTPPALSTLGRLQDLTASGKGGIQEGGHGVANRSVA